MASRDTQTVLLSRQAILLVTAVGVSLLTLSYVLGVQVGKQSAALRAGQPRAAGEDLDELPASVAEQLKAIEHSEAGFEKARAKPGVESAPDALAADPAAKEGTAPDPKPDAKAEAKPGSKPDPKAEAKPSPKPDPKAEAKPSPKPDPKADSKSDPKATGKWTLQLVSTPDAAEAQRMIAKAKGAGFAAGVVRDQGLNKVRLTQTGSREALDGLAQKLKARGFKPFLVKVEP